LSEAGGNGLCAKIILKDGLTLEGEVFGAAKSSAGEMVFNTSMVGYPEALTDPSYHGQILVFTYPMLGNYGVPEKGTDEFGLPLGLESEKIQVAGVVVQEYWDGAGHPLMKRRLNEWLKEEGLVGVSGIDTRFLTRHLRSHGTMLGKIIVDEEPDFYDPNATDVLSFVSSKEIRNFGSGRPKILLVDCGVKLSIVRSLLKRGASVLLAPYDSDIVSLSSDCDGILLSNGPGDPSKPERLLKNIRSLLKSEKPIFGICLGCQILALAAGFLTYKLPFGHRSSNQPVVDTETGRGYVTSQNHGFAAKEETLPDGWRITYRNANDGTVEGVAHFKLPYFGVQFHPEASPGPTDTAFLFDEFLELVKRR